MAMDEFSNDVVQETGVSPQQQTESATTGQPQIIEVHNKQNGRTSLWILIAVSVGFLLPVCAWRVSNPDLLR